MAKLFFDKYIEFEEVEIELKKLDMSHEEKQELHQLIDETIHHRVLTRVLKHLPKDHHEEFLGKFHRAPYDEGLISYIDDRIDERIEHHIKDEMKKLKKEILSDVLSSKRVV